MSEGDQGESGDVFDVERIRRLVRLMEEHDLSEIDLRQEDERINLKRGAAAPPAYAQPIYQPPAAPAVSSGESQGAQGGGSGGAAADGPNIVTIKSPMVGTFYDRPNPESEAFVKVGSSVGTDTTICIIEAMKVFNEIPAETSGKIVAVLVENEQSVEFGKPLFKIDTTG
jgi:acetyl-CoA carboxylase biotin carboxyl carrier protein